MSVQEHVFEGERCTFCNVNVYDTDLDDVPERCEREELMSYTTQSTDYEENTP